MKLTVFLGRDGSVTFDIELINNDFVTAWLDELSWCLENCEFDYNECFIDFLTLEEKQNKLINACEIINNYFEKSYKNPFIELPKDINWQDQDFFNYLHTKFELLSGNFSNPTKLFSLAPMHVKQSIRDLNYLIHSLEHKNNKTSYKPFNFKFAFNKEKYRRQPLQEKDYDQFSVNCEKGGLYLSYAELGKTLHDIWSENLPIEYNALKNLNYYSGECFIFFGPTHSYPEEFFQWIKNNNITDEKMLKNNGFIKLGEVKNIEEVKNKLQNNQFLHSIKIERH